MKHALSTLVVVDLEATCWPGNDHPPNEIIEIGAVAMQLAPPVEADAPEFQAFIRPHLQPTLSDFCTQLTSIQQTDVDTAAGFADVFAAFSAWIDGLTAPAVIGSWGRYDHNQLLHDCRLHGLRYPHTRHINLKQSYSRLHRTRPLGMKRALKHAGIALDGTHHRGIDDARNIARLVEKLLVDFGLPRIVEAGEWDTAAHSGQPS